MNYGILYKYDVFGMRLDSFLDNCFRSYSGKFISEVEEFWSLSYDNVNYKVVRRRERLDFRFVVLVVRYKDFVNIEDRVLIIRILKV